jgi:ABC-2 type transport system permease protein
MPQVYSQSRALWAITKASFRAIFSNPSSIVFSILFPIIFIMIFGAFGNGGSVSLRVGFDGRSDTSNQLYGIINNIKGISVIRKEQAQLLEDLEKGNLVAIITIQKRADSVLPGNVNIPYVIALKSSEAVNPQNIQVLKTMLNAIIKNVNEKIYPNTPTFAVVSNDVEKIPGRIYRQIDFILPGQLGFSILFSTLFGIAFIFFGLREQLVLKRFYASPVNRLNILLGIGMSRLFFQLINVIVLVLVGHFFMNFTLQHGTLTFIEMLLMTIIMLFLLMGVGLIISSIVKTDTSIPLLINLFGFPQMLLSGTFFTIEVFPKWLQEICKILPLTQYNDAIRKISFEGLHLFDCWKQLGILGIWIVIVYIIAVRVLKWE